MRCKQLLLWACLNAAAQMGLEKARGIGRTQWLRGLARALPARTSSRREARNGAATCTRSKNCENRSSRGESSLRLCGFALSLVRASDGASKMPRRGISQPDAPARLAVSRPVASSSPAPKACPLGCRSLVHGGSEADASLKRHAVRGVAQFEAAVRWWRSSAGCLLPTSWTSIPAGVAHSLVLSHTLNFSCRSASRYAPATQIAIGSRVGTR